MHGDSVSRMKRLLRPTLAPMYQRCAMAILVIAGALSTNAAVAHADEASYSTCMTNRMEPLGSDVPASLGSWIDLGRQVDQNVRQNGASVQSQVDMIQTTGWNHVTAGAIVQCALINSPI